MVFWVSIWIHVSIEGFLPLPDMPNFRQIVVLPNTVKKLTQHWQILALLKCLFGFILKLACYVLCHLCDCNHFSGDFDVPSSREEVNGDSMWNQWLRSEIAATFVSALDTFKVTHFIHISAISVYSIHLVTCCVRLQSTAMR